MTREIPYKPSVFLSMFVGGSLSAAWFAARPGDFVGAICLASAVTAIVLIYLMNTRFDQGIAEHRRHLRHVKRLQEAMDA